MKTKFLLSILVSMLFSTTVGVALNPLVGNLSWGVSAISFAGSFLPMQQSCAYDALSKQVWLGILKDDYEQENTWLNEAEDLSAFVASNQTLNFAEAGAAPEVYVNRTTDVDSVEPTETPNAVDLDTYDSQNYKIRNINLSTLPYDKIKFYTTKSAKAIRDKEAAAAAHSFSPTVGGTKKFVLPTTGNVDATSGKKMFTLDDVMKIAETCDSLIFPNEGRNLVLPSNMWWQLIRNNEILKAQIQYQQKIGIIDPSVVNYYGIQIHKYNHKVGYNVSTSQKSPLGTAIGGNVVDAGFLFCKTESFRGSGAFDMAYTPFSQNPKGRAHEFGFQHRFKSGLQRSGEKYTGLIYAAS